MAQGYYAADQNQTGWMYDSGTYAIESTGLLWAGMVQSNDIDEDEGQTPIRYVGAGTRNVADYVQQARIYNGTMSYFPQDFRMLGITLGINADAGSDTGQSYSHTMTEANMDNVDKHTGEIMPSFMVEDSHETLIAGSGLNLVRQVKGCMVNTLTVAGTDKDPINVDVDYLGQFIAFSSGAVTSQTADTSKPWQAHEIRWSIPSGTEYTTVKNWSLTINNNMTGPLYSNGSSYISAPIPGNRDYEVELTMNADPSRSKTLYDTHLRSGVEFNMQAYGLNLGTAQSGVTVMTFSGCKLLDMDIPTPNEGVNEWTVTIKPTSMWAKIEDDIQFYNNGSFA